MIDYFRTIESVDEEIQNEDIDDRLKDYDTNYIEWEYGEENGFLHTHFDVKWDSNPSFSLLPSWMPSVFDNV